MKNLTLLTALFLLSAVIPSCKKNVIVDPGPVEQILPLAPGNTWNYNNFWVGPNVTYRDTFQTNMQVIRLDTVKSFIGYRVTDFIYWFWRTMYCINKSDGVHIAYDPDEGAPIPVPPSPPNPPKPLVVGKGLSFPTFVGDTWEFDGYVIRTRDLSKTIVTPLGTFSCIAYEAFLNETLVAEIWVKPNLGVLRATEKSGSDTKVTELVSYILY